MKVWTVTYNDDNGIITDIANTEKVAENAAWDWTNGKWPEHFSQEPMPDDWRIAFDRLTDENLFIDSIHIAEHVI